VRADGVASIRERGRRLTPQRSVIWDTLIAKGGGARERRRARRRRARASAGAAPLDRVPDARRPGRGRPRLRTDLGGDRSYYELAAEHHHHHVVCSGCGAIAHVHDEAIAAAVACVQAASGYRLARQELTFAGLCPVCAARHRADP
jgi:Fur family ferric uptake transcriptional regulator